MDGNLKIETKDLKTWAGILLDEIASSTPVIELPQEYYWAIPSSDRYDMSREGPRSTIGSLSEDVMQMQRLISIRSSDGMINQQLIWLGAIITAIGEREGYLRDKGQTEAQ